MCEWTGDVPNRGGKMWKEATDEHLLDAVRDGNIDAFGVLYRRHKQLALGTARRLLWDKTLAEDAVQEAFACVLKAIGGGAGPRGVFTPYLVSAVSRIVYRLNAKALKESMTLDSHLLDAFEDGCPGPGWMAVDTLTNIIDELDRNHVHTVLDSLPRRWRHVLWCLHVEDMKPSDLAPLLEISPNAVVALHKRAKTGLAKAYNAKSQSSTN